MDADKRAYLVITEASGGEDGEFFYEINHTFRAEDNPENILFALAALGLSWELKNSGARIIEIAREWTGEELLKLAHMKINNSGLVPEDTPEEPEPDLFDPNGPRMSISLKFDIKEIEGVREEE